MRTYGPLSNIVNFLASNSRKIFEGQIWFHSPGHMILENDYVARIALSDPIYKSQPPLLIVQQNERTEFIKAVFEHSNVPIQVLYSENSVPIQMEIARFFPELTITCGLWSFRTSSDKPNCEHDFRFIWEELPSHNYSLSKYYLNLQRKTREINVWKRYVDDILLRQESNQEFIDYLRQSPFVALQIRYATERDRMIRTGTGSSGVVDNEDLIPLIEYLLDSGLRVVQLGREQLPEILSHYPIFHYPSSKFVSFSNDFVLARLAKSAMIFGSGIGHLYNLIGNPFVTVNLWDMNPYSYSSTALMPSRIIDTVTASELDFVGHMNAFNEIARLGRGAFSNQSRFVSIKTSPQVYKDLMIEYIEPGAENDNLSDSLRKKAASLDPSGKWSLADCRLPICIRKHLPNYI